MKNQGNSAQSANRPVPFTLLSVDQLKDMPPPSWLIKGLVEEGVLAVLYGASGEGKSFVALDWSLSIATGHVWHGRPVKRGPVIYVVAEGSRNVGKRVKAWQIQYDLKAVGDDMLVVLDAIQFKDQSHVDELLRQIKERQVRPRLIVVDTLARCFLGGDENSSQDMGAFVAACNQIQKATGACVLAIHHTGKPKGNNRKVAERGSYALRAAADVMIRASKVDGLVKIEVDKQKDDEQADPIHLRMKIIEVGRDSESGDRITSCVLVAAERPIIDLGPSLGAGPLATLKALAGMPSGAAHSGTWRKAIPPSNGKPLPQKTFHNHRQLLIDEEFVQDIPDRNNWYRVTPSGGAMANGVPLQRQQQKPNDAATATPPEGGGSGTREHRTESFSEVMNRMNKPGTHVRFST